jgi:hypothetical protein
MVYWWAQILQFGRFGPGGDRERARIAGSPWPGLRKDRRGPAVWHCGDGIGTGQVGLLQVLARAFVVRELVAERDCAGMSSA